MFGEKSLTILRVYSLNIFTLDHRGKITRNNLTLTLFDGGLLDKCPDTKNPLPFEEKKLNKMRSGVSIMGSTGLGKL